jgi:small nuclear ribonucleoprotein (snRNP)-like protein
MAEGRPLTPQGATGEAFFRGYLNRRVRVHISDGRSLDGDFACTDKELNLVLINTDESLPGVYCRPKMSVPIFLLPPRSECGNVRCKCRLANGGSPIQDCFFLSTPSPEAMSGRSSLGSLNA